MICFRRFCSPSSCAFAAVRSSLSALSRPRVSAARDCRVLRYAEATAKSPALRIPTKRVKPSSK